MTLQQGRDNEETTTRGEGMTTGDGSTARQSPNTGMPGGRAGVDSESVDFDDMGDLDRGADDAVNAEPSTGPGPGYGMAGGPGRTTSRTSELSGAGNTGSDVRQADLSSYGESTGTDATGVRNASAVDAGSIVTDSTDLNAGRSEAGAGGGTATAPRGADVTGGMGSDVGDEQGIGQGGDIDVTSSRGDAPATGTSQRAGLGGRSSGQELDVDPSAGSGMANPADMGDQG